MISNKAFPCPHRFVRGLTCVDCGKAVTKAEADKAPYYETEAADSGRPAPTPAHGNDTANQEDTKSPAPRREKPIHRLWEYDGAFSCLDCGAKWGALTNAPEAPPDLCIKKNAPAPQSIAVPPSPSLGFDPRALSGAEKVAGPVPAPRSEVDEALAMADAPYCPLCYGRPRCARCKAEDTLAADLRSARAELAECVETIVDWRDRFTEMERKYNGASEIATKWAHTAGENRIRAEAAESRISTLQAELDEAKKRAGFILLTGTEKPADALASALAFEDSNSKEQMMCGWQKVHWELHVIATEYRRLLSVQAPALKPCGGKHLGPHSNQANVLTIAVAALDEAKEAYRAILAAQNPDHKDEIQAKQGKIILKLRAEREKERAAIVEACGCRHMTDGPGGECWSECEVCKHPMLKAVVVAALPPAKEE